MKTDKKQKTVKVVVKPEATQCEFWAVMPLIGSTVVAFVREVQS